MRKHRFFVTESVAIGAKITLSEEISHQITRVLRLEINNFIFLFNNTGYEFTAIINNIFKKNVDVIITQMQPDTLESPFKINLAQVIAKGDKMDFIIQKSTELGVNSITPLYSERTVVRKVAERTENKIEHWQKVAIAASCQSWRNYVPIINHPNSLTTWFAEHQATNKLILSPHISAKRLKDLNIQSSATILIGPEGGFTEEEFDLAVSLNFTPVSLGPRVLRTETAGIAAIAILQSMFGDC